MIRTLIPAIALLLAACAGPADEAPKVEPVGEPAALAQSQGDGSVERAQELMDRLVGPRGRVTVSKLDSGWFQVRAGTNFGYIDPSSTFFIEGDLVELATGNNLTDASRRIERRGAVADLQKSVISYAPKGGNPLYTVTVFTDVDCGYCRKLHGQIDEYLAAGITVNYVLYARGGAGSDAFETAEKIWCSKDRKASLTAATGGKLVKANGDCDNPMRRHLAAAARLGVRGTPTGFLPDGEEISGYMPADELRRRLDAYYSRGNRQHSDGKPG